MGFQILSETKGLGLYLSPVLRDFLQGFPWVMGKLCPHDLPWGKYRRKRIPQHEEAGLELRKQSELPRDMKKLVSLEEASTGGQRERGVTGRGAMLHLYLFQAGSHLHQEAWPEAEQVHTI